MKAQHQHALGRVDENANQGSRKLSDASLMNAMTALLYREAEYIDARRWDEWLALFDPKAEY